MIPIRLELENFLSYGKRQIVEFAGYPLICLSGKNGHGKSALLDAMTWAIWGQARKVAGASKPDENLIRLGQTFMTVIFEFEFNGSKYRIKREYAKTYAKPYASLDFGIYDHTTNSIRALTDKTIRATQEKIEHTIGLDYDTFINSAFLRQGGSNEFSKKSAKERKQILSAILGLNQFENLKKRALDKARDLTSQKKYMVEHTEKVKVQLERTEHVTTALHTLTSKLKALSHITAQQEEAYKKLAQEKQELAGKFEQHKQLGTQRQELENEKAIAEQGLRTVWHQWRSVRRTVACMHNKQQLEARKQTLSQALGAHQKTFEQQLGYKEQTLQLKEQLSHLHQQLKAQHEKERQEQQLNAAHQEMLKRDFSNKLDLCIKTHEHSTKQITLGLKQMTELKVSIERVEKTIELQEKQRPIFEKRKNYYHSWVAQAQQLVKEQNDVHQKKQLSLEQENPSCPLCEQNLSAARKRFIHTKLMHREQFIAARLARLKGIITPLKQALIAEHAQLEEVQKLKQDLERQRVQLSHSQKEHESHMALIRESEKQQVALTKELSAIQSAHVKSIALLKELETTQEKLILEHAPSQVLITQLKEIEKKSIELNYNPQLHHADKKSLDELEQQLQAYVSIQEEMGKQAERKHAILTYLSTLRAHKKQWALLSSSIHQLSTLDEQQQKISLNEKELIEAVNTHQKEKESLTREQGSLEHELKQLQLLVKELAEEQKQITNLDTSSFEYGAIATALGKDGIQALLIEETIPEIEHEANALLAQLSDNQAHIMIESLKDLKKGGTKETLDINISDAQGIRPYELFSGGEAFRIDFALRIAISKLLARRAGTSLQTLIIDEGFGSQDEEGLQRLMEAIYAIQDNFCKIIIVSHLPSMKEQFPVHFVIDKGPQGSTVHVVEQG